MPDIDRDLDELLEQGTDVELPIDVRHSMQNRLAEFRTRIEERPTHRWISALVYAPAFRIGAIVTAAVLLIATILVIIPIGSNHARVYAAAAAQLRTAQSLQYTVEIAPMATVDFSYAAPAFRRVNCSWGTEIRSDGSGRELILMHLTRSYILEQGKKVEDLGNSSDLIEQFRKLPRTSGNFIGEQRIGNKKFAGYRVLAEAGASSGQTTLDLWVDTETSNPDHADISIKEPNKPVYQMHVTNIRVDGGVDRAQFEMNPPAGYVSMLASGAGQNTGERNALPIDLHPEIAQVEQQTAVVLPMKGSYAQTRVAVAAVQSQVEKMGIKPIGPTFGRFASEAEWDAGYFVRAETQVDAPFRVITLPATQVAHVTVKGPWGQNSNQRWDVLFKWVVDRGYMIDGPPTEIWTGDDTHPNTQVTEMRIAVKKAG